jgi:cell division septation protein DedD
MDPATSAPQSEPQPGAAQRRIVLSFCATVLIGVLLSVGYLVSGTGRAAARVTPAASVSQTSVAPSLSKPPVSLPVTAPPPAVAIRPAARIEPKEKKPAVIEPRPATIGATYLQMAAVDRGVAEVYLEVLRRKGFQARIADGPTPDIFRVLVGPVKDAASLARVKADLQAEGFTSFPRKLTGE